MFIDYPPPKICYNNHMRKPVLNTSKLREQELKLGETIILDGAKVINGNLTSESLDELSVETSYLENIIFNSVTIGEFESKDSLFSKCSFAGAQCDRSYLVRTEISNSRLQGIQMTEGVLIDTVIVDSKCSMANFRFSSLKNVIFKNCDLKEIDFLGAKLESVTFKNCDLSDSEFSQSKLKKVSFKGSVITNIHIDKDSFGEVTVDSGQAIYLASVFGLTVED